MGHGSGPRDGVPRIAGIEPSLLVDRFTKEGWPAAVVLLACRSAEGAEGAQSFADHLLHEGTPAVVGMLGDVETGPAPAFLRGLLDALEAGAGLEAAVQQARVRIGHDGRRLVAMGFAGADRCRRGLLSPPQSAPSSGDEGLDELDKVRNRTVVVAKDLIVRGDFIGSVNEGSDPNQTEVFLERAVIEGDFTGAIHRWTGTGSSS